MLKKNDGRKKEEEREEEKNTLEKYSTVGGVVTVHYSTAKKNEKSVFGW